MLSIPEEVSYANQKKDIFKKKVPENQQIWQITWWTCKVVWWKEWKETSWWWQLQSQQLFGSTLSSQDFSQLKFPFHSLKSLNLWLSLESISKILMLVTYLGLLSISWSCLVWVKLTAYSWKKIILTMKPKVNLLKNLELQEVWEETLWWVEVCQEWWDQEWWINQQIKIRFKRIFSSLKFNL